MGDQATARTKSTDLVGDGRQGIRVVEQVGDAGVQAEFVARDDGAHDVWVVAHGQDEVAEVLRAGRLGQVHAPEHRAGGDDRRPKREGAERP